MNACTFSDIKKIILACLCLVLTAPLWAMIFAQVLLWYAIGMTLQSITPTRHHHTLFYASKRALDRVVSGTILWVLVPALLVLALLNILILGAPVLFRQRRVGQYKKCFEIIKFRSMTQANPSGRLMLPDEIELSNYGKFLRRYSLDELPSLWNVLKGDMSLVGPRPLVPEFLTDSVPALRHKVRPGLTGWAQVNGRNTLTWSEKFTYDITYVSHPSYTLDIKILWLTIGVLCRAEHTQLATKNNFFP